MRASSRLAVDCKRDKDCRTHTHNNDTNKCAELVLYTEDSVAAGALTWIIIKCHWRRWTRSCKPSTFDSQSSLTSPTNFRNKAFGSQTLNSSPKITPQRYFKVNEFCLHYLHVFPPGRPRCQTKLEPDVVVCSNKTFISSMRRAAGVSSRVACLRNLVPIATRFSELAWTIRLT